MMAQWLKSLRKYTQSPSQWKNNAKEYVYFPYSQWKIYTGKHIQPEYNMNSMLS